jgi:hypothetical protein
MGNDVIHDNYVEAHEVDELTKFPALTHAN